MNTAEILSVATRKYISRKKWDIDRDLWVDIRFDDFIQHEYKQVYIGRWLGIPKQWPNKIFYEIIEIYGSVLDPLDPLNLFRLIDNALVNAMYRLHRRVIEYDDFTDWVEEVRSTK